MDPQPIPELCPLAAVVQLALRDLQKRRHQAEARAFIESEDCAAFCDILGWDVVVLRERVAEAGG